MSQIKTHKCRWLDRTLDIRFLNLFTFFPEIEWNYEVFKLIFSGKKRFDISVKMLYIFLVDTGNMVQLDMNLALETVGYLKGVVAR